MTVVFLSTKRELAAALTNCIRPSPNNDGYDDDVSYEVWRIYKQRLARAKCVLRYSIGTGWSKFTF